MRVKGLPHPGCRDVDAVGERQVLLVLVSHELGDVQWLKNLLAEILSWTGLLNIKPLISARGTEGEATQPLNDVYPYAAIQQLILLLRIAAYVARVDHEMVCT